MCSSEHFGISFVTFGQVIKKLLILQFYTYFCLLFIFPEKLHGTFYTRAGLARATDVWGPTPWWRPRKQARPTAGFDHVVARTVASDGSDRDGGEHGSLARERARMIYGTQQTRTVAGYFLAVPQPKWSPAKAPATSYGGEALRSTTESMATRRFRARKRGRRGPEGP